MRAQAKVLVPEGEFPHEVAPGVYLLRMPLPFRLNHINVYILDDPEGWTLVDCGLNSPDTIAAWEQLFDTFLRGKPVVRIVVTHLHPDHIGMAQWLHEKTGAPVRMTAIELEMAHRVFNLPISDPPRIRAHYQRLGVEGKRLEAMVTQASTYRTLVKVLPAWVECLGVRDALTVGKRTWRILIGRGHSPGCACLWSSSDGILIAGDHVLPNISPNINLLSVGPVNPLDEYLTSLDVFGCLLCTLLLPAHGLPTTCFRDRVSELIDHHVQRLEHLKRICTEPRTAADCVPYLFESSLPDHQYYFAIGEAAAHLVYLAERGRLRREDDTVWRFSRP